MQTKRKVSLTIDAEVFDSIEKAAKMRHLARSHIAQKAFELWLQKENEALMARGYEEMAAEDRALAEQAFDAQREVLA